MGLLLLGSVTRAASGPAPWSGETAAAVPGPAPVPAPAKSLASERGEALPRLRVLALDVAGKAVVLAVGDGAARLIRTGEDLPGFASVRVTEVMPDRLVLDVATTGGKERVWVYPLARGARESRVKWLRVRPPAGSVPLTYGPISRDHFVSLPGGVERRSPAPDGASVAAPTATPTPEPHH